MYNTRGLKRGLPMSIRERRSLRKRLNQWFFLVAANNFHKQNIAILAMYHIALYLNRYKPLTRLDFRLREAGQ